MPVAVRQQTTTACTATVSTVATGSASNAIGTSGATTATACTATTAATVATVAADLLVRHQLHIVDPGTEQFVLQQAAVGETVATIFATIALLLRRLRGVFVRFGAERREGRVPVVVGAVARKNKRFVDVSIWCDGIMPTPDLPAGNEAIVRGRCFTNGKEAACGRTVMLQVARLVTGTEHDELDGCVATGTGLCIVWEICRVQFGSERVGFRWSSPPARRSVFANLPTHTRTRGHGARGTVTICNASTARQMTTLATSV